MPKGGVRPGVGRPKKEDLTPEKTEQRAMAKRLRYLERREAWRKEAADNKAKGIAPNSKRGDPSLYGVISGEEKKALRAMKWRVPKDAPEAAAELAGEALEKIVKVMRQGVHFKNARNVLSSAVALRDDICGPVVRKMEVSAHMTYEQLVNASMGKDVIEGEAKVLPEKTYEEDPSRIAGEDEV